MIILVVRYVCFRDSLFAFLRVLSFHSACPSDGGSGWTSAAKGLSEQLATWPCGSLFLLGVVNHLRYFKWALLVGNVFRTTVGK